MDIIKSIKKIKEEDVNFEDEILIEENIINALTTMGKTEIKNIFGLEELKSDEDYYDVYLDYNYENNKCEINIVAVTDNDRLYHKYIPSLQEQEILKNKLENYILVHDGKSMQELINENQNLSEENEEGEEL